MRSAALAALAAMREETPGLEELLGCVEVLDQSLFTSSPFRMHLPSFCIAR